MKFALANAGLEGVGVMVGVGVFVAVAVGVDEGVFVARCMLEEVAPILEFQCRLVVAR